MPAKPNHAYSWPKNRNARDCYCNLPRFGHALGTPHRICKSRWYLHHAAWRTHNKLHKSSGIHPTTCTPGSERWMVYDEDQGEYVDVDVSLPGEKDRVREETRKRFACREMKDVQTLGMGASLNCAGGRKVVERNPPLFAVVIDLDTMRNRTLVGQTSGSAGGGQEGTELFPVEINSDTKDRKRQERMERMVRRVERGERRREKGARRRERNERRKAKDARRMERIERKQMVQGK